MMEIIISMVIAVPCATKKKLYIPRHATFSMVLATHIFIQGQLKPYHLVIFCDHQKIFSSVLLGRWNVFPGKMLQNANMQMKTVSLY